MFEIDQLGLNWFKLDQNGSNWIKLVQSWIKMVQIESNWFKLVIRLDQIGSNFSERCLTFLSHVLFLILNQAPNQIVTRKCQINIHGRTLFFWNKSAMDSLIRHWTLIRFLPFALFKYLLITVSQAFYSKSTKHGINKQFNRKTRWKGFQIFHS